VVLELRFDLRRYSVFDGINLGKAVAQPGNNGQIIPGLGSELRIRSTGRFAAERGRSESLLTPLKAR
ncbi:hypothetical protein, partial [Massilia aurea]|uniref:hypothetical protein n=1 Tax=Massilia aurea TaxID=373040 RepID=UPI001C83171E